MEPEMSNKIIVLIIGLVASFIFFLIVKKALPLFITILEKVELSPFKRIRLFLSKDEEKSLFRSLIMIAAVFSIIWIFFSEIYQISHVSLHIEGLCVMWFLILPPFIISLVTNSCFIFPAICVHAFFGFYFYKGILPFAAIEQGYIFLFQICISYLWWLSFSYFHRFAIIHSKLNQRDPLALLGIMLPMYVYWIISRY